ncbi:sensor histidine kinase [Halalkalibacter wakoensis JCM 9140]|uniref:histidine kinase n=1 Tax=Halalkalibacter wakoensis JCM 9140 TaxID=1236970 RepID=W4Q2D9_9BACI|nr:HAMP domain-containing sensor histidine kinase [Halalkalibacter wakoensis]GAE25514.1 sensor histidine kinase [Halalkalibacter wakoensis JCM 9140]
MSISRRIAWFSTVWLFVLLLVINGGVYFLFKYYTSEAELQRVTAQAQSISEAIRPDRGLSTGQTELLTAYVPGDGMIRIIRNDNSEAITITKDPSFRSIPRNYTTAQQTEQMLHDNQTFAIAWFPVIWNDGSIVTLQYVERMDTYESTLSILRIVLLISSLLIMVPAFLAGRTLSQLLVKPIQSLTETMESIRKSGSFQRIHIENKSNDELDQMGHTFNKMIEMLENNYEKQQQFVSDASHELRTPLTVIESYSRMLKRWGMSDPDRLKEAVDAIYDESQRMKGLTIQMLSLASGELDQSLELKEIDLSLLTKETSKKLKQVYEREITVEACEPTIILADDAKMKQLLVILLENGLKYSSDELRIILSRVEGYVKVEVSDRGIGIPNQDIPHIFERFFRVDQARSRKTGGSGLGLAIAKTIVDAHGGKITVKSQEQVGTTFTILLPDLQRKVIRDEGKDNE